MIVLDSSFLIAFHNKRDINHALARNLMDQFLTGKWGKGLLLEYVVLEVTTVLLIRRDHMTAVRVARILLDSEELELVPCSDIFLDTFEDFAKQQETHLSFADTAISVVARNRAAGLVLSFDDEFRRIPGLQTIPESH